MRPLDPRLLRTLPAARAPLAALAVVGVLAGVATIGSAFALAALVVAVVGSGGLAGPAAWLAGLLVVRAALAAVQEHVGAWAGVAVSGALRTALVATWGGRAPEERPDPAAAVALATQGAAAVEPYAARFLPTLVTAAVVPALALGTLVVVDWPSALVVALTLPLLPLFAALIGRATEESTRRRWSALADLSGHFLDVVRGLPTLVAYGRAERQVAVVRDVSERHRRATMRTLRVAFLSSAALELLATISVAVVAVTVGLRLSHGSLALGTGLLAILLAPEAYWPVRRVGAEFHAAADGAVALASILDELSAPNESFGSERVGAPALSRPNDSFGQAGERGRVRVRGLSYAHPGAASPVLRGVDLDVGPGLTVVTGTSGVGKSTLLELVSGRRRPDTGTAQAPPAHHVTQRPFIGSGTVREALTIGHPATDERLWAALRDVGLDGVVAALPDGLGTRLGDDGFGLSAGQRQRLALARAVLAPEPLLLLDEPTAHLDPDGARELSALVAALACERVVVAVTHDPVLVERADRHLELRRTDDGARLVERVPASASEGADG